MPIGRAGIVKTVILQDRQIITADGGRRAQTGSSLPAGLEVERRAISSLKYPRAFFSGGEAVGGIHVKGKVAT